MADENAAIRHLEDRLHTEKGNIDFNTKELAKLVQAEEMAHESTEIARRRVQESRKAVAEIEAALERLLPS